MTDKPRIAVDFDGVIHRYTVWDGNPPKGKPVVGVRFALKRLVQAGFDLVVFTAREANYVLDWLTFYDLKQYFIKITNQKTPDLVAFFDDRAWRVESNRHNGLMGSVDEFLAHESEVRELPPIVSISQARLELP